MQVNIGLFKNIIKEFRTMDSAGNKIALRYDNIIKIIDKLKPKTILEVGTHGGFTAIKMINCAKRHNKDIKYYGFDLFEDMTSNIKKLELHAKRDVKRKEAEKGISKTGCEYEFIVGNTVDTMPNFNPDRPIDFVFVDGGHSLDTIASDWSNIERIMNDHTVVVFDDYYENRDDFGCKSLINSLKKQSMFKIELLNPVDKVPAMYGKDILHVRLVKVKRN
jgi:predicted O-methyltransferase YrrM